MTDEQTIRKLIRNTDKMMDELADLKMMINAKNRSPWMTVAEAANYVGYSESHFYKIIQYKKEIPYFQRDGRKMIRIDDVEAWMNKNKIQVV